RRRVRPFVAGAGDDVPQLPRAVRRPANPGDNHESRPRQPLQALVHDRPCSAEDLGAEPLELKPAQLVEAVRRAHRPPVCPRRYDRAGATVAVGPALRSPRSAIVPATTRKTLAAIRTAGAGRRRFASGAIAKAPIIVVVISADEKPNAAPCRPGWTSCCSAVS